MIDNNADIVICKHCNGLGKIVHIASFHCHNDTDYERSEWLCDKCDGYGRLIQNITYKKLTKEDLKIVPKIKYSN